MQISKTVDINKPADEVWNILGPQYEQADTWASAVFVSRAKTDKPHLPGAPVAGRVCETSLGPFNENLVEYDPVKHKIAYSASGAKMPGFMRSLVNSWRVMPNDNASCRVVMQLNADIAQPFKFLMGWMMKSQFNGALSDSIDDLKVYAETGKPSGRKQKADSSKKAKKAKSLATT